MKTVLVFWILILSVFGCASSPRTVGEVSYGIDFHKCRKLENKRLGWEKGPAGTIQIEYTVDPKGNLVSTKILKNTTKNKELEDCFIGLIRSTDFPAEGGTENIVSKYTMDVCRKKCNGEESCPPCN